MAAAPPLREALKQESWSRIDDRRDGPALTAFLLADPLLLRLLSLLIRELDLVDPAARLSLGRFGGQRSGRRQSDQ
jgi:hypothetical protein